MNIPFLYRAKRKDNGELIEGYCGVDYEGDTYIDVWGRLPSNVTVTTVPVQNCLRIYVVPESIQTYTGKVDKNGERIFSGDFLMFGKQDFFGIIMKQTYKVVWNITN